MTSILTNSAAMAALQTLRTIGSSLDRTQEQVSSGLRVKAASDNAAYWSISTTMRSDNMAISAVADALGLGAATVDVAYSAMESTVDVLTEMKKKLVAAKEPGVDKNKIQREISQLQDSLLSLSSSASFSGVNWLSTDIPNLINADLQSRSTSIVSSFVRSTDGSVRVGTVNIDRAQTSLFNTGGGGILQTDLRDLREIRGLRTAIPDADGYYIAYSKPSVTGENFGNTLLDHGYPLDFNIVEYDTNLIFGFDVQEYLDTGVSTPDSPTYNIKIDKSVIDTIYPANGGIINNVYEMASVWAYALRNHPLVVTVSSGEVHINTKEPFPYKNSSWQLTPIGQGMSLSAAVIDHSTGDAGQVPQDLIIPFNAPFQIDGSESVDVGIRFNDKSANFIINKDIIFSLLGNNSGDVASSADLTTILNASISIPGLIITDTGSGVRFHIDPNVDIRGGSKAGISISTAVSNEPRLEINVVDIDVSANPHFTDAYIETVERALSGVTDGASSLGAIKRRVDMQSDFAATLMETLSKGIGRLVDADMDEASTRLKALQTQQQLAIQALQIANSNAENVMQLFRQ